MGIWASFWYDHWTDLGRLIDLTRVRGARDLGISLNATVSEAVNLVRRTRRQRSTTLNLIVSALEQVSTSGPTGGIDVVLWKQGENIFRSVFSSKLTWEQIRRRQPTVSWSKVIWFNYAVPKYAFLSWIAVKDRLPTATRIASWSRGTYTSCIFCHDQQEDRHHLFFRCTYSEQIWKRIVGGLLSSSYTNQWDSIIIILQIASEDWETQFLFRLAFQSTLYHIWNERNARRHGQTHTTLQKIVAMIDKSIRDKLISIRSLGDHKYDATLLRWFSSRA